MIYPYHLETPKHKHYMKSYSKYCKAQSSLASSYNMSIVGKFIFSSVCTLSHLMQNIAIVSFVHRSMCIPCYSFPSVASIFNALVSYGLLMILHLDSSILTSKTLLSHPLHMEFYLTQSGMESSRTDCSLNCCTWIIHMPTHYPINLVDQQLKTLENFPRSSSLLQSTHHYMDDM